MDINEFKAGVWEDQYQYQSFLPASAVALSGTSHVENSGIEKETEGLLKKLISFGEQA